MSQLGQERAFVAARNRVCNAPPKFPQPVRVTERRLGFDVEEVRVWAEERKNSARGACDDPFSDIR